MIQTPLTELLTADRVMKAMVQKFPTSDQTVGEASRFLYGTNRETGIVIPIGNILDLEEAKELVKLAPPATERQQAAPPDRQRAPFRPPPAGMQYTVLGVIQEYAPRAHRENTNPRSRWTLRCPV